MKNLNYLCIWTSVRAALGICAALTTCIVAGCTSCAQAGLDDFSGKTDIRFPSSARLERDMDTDPETKEAMACSKIVTDKAGFASVVAALPRTSANWSEAFKCQRDFSILSTTDRLGISDNRAGKNLSEQPSQLPQWWKPDSIRAFVVSQGVKEFTHWSLIGGEDSSGEYVIYLFYFEA